MDNTYSSLSEGTKFEPWPLFYLFFFSFNVHSPSKDMLDISYNAYIRTFYDVAFTIFEFFFFNQKI